MTDSEFAYFQAALQMKFGYIIGIATWQTSIRLTMGFINTQLKNAMETAIPDDKAWIQGILDSKVYRVVSFVLNLVVSVKLPREARKVGETNLMKPPP